MKKIYLKYRFSFLACLIVDFLSFGFIFSEPSNYLNYDIDFLSLYIYTLLLCFALSGIISYLLAKNILGVSIVSSLTTIISLIVLNFLEGDYDGAFMSILFFAVIGFIFTLFFSSATSLIYHTIKKSQ